MFKVIKSIIFILYTTIEYSVSQNVDVITSSGLIRGQSIKVLNKTVNQFLGIPYAMPPLGNLRFEKPKPIEKPLEGIIDATKPKHSCIQPFNVPNQSEDCLVLNIWSPKQQQNSSLNPVMFWIYGGGLTTGTIFNSNFNGSVLATNDVVFVSTNYRVGNLGFLYAGNESAPGNVGFFDQLLALKWITDNIHLFGGDKNQITIFGESAGSWSVSAHILSPLTKGLFKRAIMQSGALLYNKDRWVISKVEAILKAKQLAKRVNCKDDNQWLDCLKTVNPNLLNSVNHELIFPMEGTEFLPLSAQQSFALNNFNKDLDLMAGVVKDEGSTLTHVISPEVSVKFLTKNDFIKFVDSSNDMFHNLNVEKLTQFYLNNVNHFDSNEIKWRIYDFFGDLVIKCPTYLFAKSYAIHSGPETNVFFCELTTTATGFISDQLFGVSHDSDLIFVFGRLLLNPESSTPENIQLSRDVVRMWTNFAKTGVPDPNWHKLIDNNNNNSVSIVKDLNNRKNYEYFINPFADTCDGVWSDYY